MTLSKLVVTQEWMCTVTPTESRFVAVRTRYTHLVLTCTCQSHNVSYSAQQTGSYWEFGLVLVGPCTLMPLVHEKSRQ